MIEERISDTLGSIPDWLQAVAALGQLMAVSLAAVVAYRGLSVWRDQKLQGRRIDLAENAIRGFIRIRELILDITNGAVFSGEIQDMQSNFLMEFPESEREELATYAAPAFRINKYRQEFYDFFDQKYLIQAYFGQEAAQKYTRVHEVLRRIQIASEMLVRHRSNGNETWEFERPNQEIWEKLRLTIWMAADETHPERMKLEAACQEAILYFSHLLGNDVPAAKA